MGRMKGETSAYFEDGRVRSGNSYALVLDEVLRSEAFKLLPDYAVRVLLVLTAAFRKQNNGDLSLTSKSAADYGIASWKLRAGLSVLERVGLIETTRRGKIMAGKGICSLYALGWRQIDPSEKHDIPSVVAVKAPNRWALWQKPRDWDAQLSEIKSAAQGKRPNWEAAVKSARLTRVSQAGSPVCTERPKSRTTRVSQERAFPVPPVYDTSQRSGCTPTRGVGQQLADAHLADLLAVARANPEIQVAELAKRCRVSETDAHRALQQLQAAAS